MIIPRGPVSGAIEAHAIPGNNLFGLTQPFGCTGYGGELPYGDCKHFHRGIDLGNGRAGDPVAAVERGVVTAAGPDWTSGGALRVWMWHPGGWFSGYYHLQSIVSTVRVGTTVARGARIGKVGATGWADFPHLHFEVHSSDNPNSMIDPWPRIWQNVRVHAKPSDGIRIRNAATLEASSIYATTEAGLFVRASDGSDRGEAGLWRKWDGVIKGARYELPDGSSSDRWERVYLDGRYRVMASLLAVRSAS